ncbi:autoinducer synthase [Alphaproteobacteria bacterium KMM 3653]|uniref:Acyl-homoserine-lactone synthase n=1 Tax=Harenicola maris TaxID=2841044 RepID=A0AAP2CPC9_9RHOB|nr:autoinducer synthase [Harenicola maris]
MLRYLTSPQLADYPKLSATMFADRTAQFKTRLGWDVTVDATGAERDAYDDKDPTYIVWQRSDGSHGGSMRFMPTTAPCMLNDHFAHLNKGAPLQSPLIWESTRFCLAPGAPAEVSAALMLGGAELALALGVSEVAGVFDARMLRIYGRLGWPPRVIGTAGEGRGKVSLGLWSIDSAVRLRMCAKAGIAPRLSELWRRRSLGDAPVLALAG